ncbi:MAG: hypothetical protein ACRDHE_10395 [Ktedonobacterales bacterium]
MDIIDFVFLLVRVPVFIVAFAVITPLYAVAVLFSGILAVVVFPFIFIYAALQNDRDLIKSYAWQPLTNVLDSAKSSYTILFDWLLGKIGTSSYSRSKGQPNPLAAIGGMLAILSYFAFPISQFHYGQYVFSFTSSQAGGNASYLYLTLGSAIVAVLVASLPIIKERKGIVVIASLVGGAGLVGTYVELRRQAVGSIEVRAGFGFWMMAAAMALIFIGGARED